MDPAIKHQAINAADVIPATNPEYAFNKNPARAWCEATAQTICIQSRYQLEGKLPAGIQLANQLVDGRKHVDFLEFQSELRVVPQLEIKQDEIKKLTGLDTPVIGVLEQNIFYVNQVMEFGKYFAVLQQHPTDKTKTIATTYMALAIKKQGVGPQEAVRESSRAAQSGSVTGFDGEQLVQYRPLSQRRLAKLCPQPDSGGR